MPELPVVGARVPQDWQKQIQGIAAVAGRKEAEIVREEIAQYLGQTDPNNVKGAVTDLQDKVACLERKLAGLDPLVG